MQAYMRVAMTDTNAFLVEPIVVISYYGGLRLLIRLGSRGLRSG